MSKAPGVSHNNATSHSREQAMKKAGFGYIRLSSTGTIEDIDETAVAILGLQLKTSSIMDKSFSDFKLLETIYQSVSSYFANNAGIMHYQFTSAVNPATGMRILVNATREGKKSDGIEIIINEIPGDLAGKGLKQQYTAQEILLNTTTDFSLLIDLEGNILAINSAGLETINTSYDEAINSNVYNFFPGELAEERKKIGEWVLENDQPYFYEEFRGGKSFLNKVYPVRQEGGAIDSFAIFVHDITTLKETEAKLRMSKETERALLNASPDMALLIDNQGSIIAVNEAVSKYLGKAPKELVGNNIFNQFPQAVSLYRKARINEVVRSGKPMNMEDKVEDRYFYSRVYPVFNDEREVIQVAIFGQDITERRLLDQALAESEKRFRTLQENVPIGVYRSIPAGRLISVNPTAVNLLGYESEEELLNTPVEDLYYDPAQREKFITRLNSEGVVQDEEVVFTRKDGTKFWAMISASTEYDENGNPKLYDGVFKDITIRKEAQEEAVKAKDFLKRITDNMLDMVSVTDSKGKLKYISPSHNRILGYGPEDFAGASIFKYVHPEDLERTVSAFKECVKNKQPVRVDVRLMNNRSEYIWLESVGVVATDRRGNVESVIIASRDISERKSAELAMQKSEANLRAILENTFSSIILYDTEKRILAFNKIAYHDTNKYFDVELVVNSSFAEIFSNSDAQVQFDKDFSGVLNGEIIRKEEKIKSDWFDVIISPVYKDDEIIGVTSVSTDITNRKKAEEAVKRIEDNLKLTLEAATDGIWDWNIKTNAAHFSPNYYRMLGYEPDEFEATYESWITSIHPDDKTSALETINSHLKSNDEIYTNQFRLRTKVGDYKWINAKGKVVERDDDGNPLRMIGNHEDITISKHNEEERRRLEVQLQQAQKMESLGILAGGVAHDFNNLLQSINGNTSLAMIDLPEDSELKQILQQIRESALHATALTRQMLAYAGKGQYVVKLVNLSEIIVEMDQLLKVGISRKTNLRLALDYQLPFIAADEIQIKQIVMNLVLNASEASKDKDAEITVGTGKSYCTAEYLANTYLNDNLAEGEYVFVEVTDQGIGIEEETLKKMFDPFFSTKFIGRGLGLATVLGIVRAHRGAIEVSSQLNAGTKFRVLFPATEKIEEQIQTSRTVDPKLYEGWLVLFVDDEELVRNVAKKMLRRKGFEVITAEDGPNGIELYKKHMKDINLVLVDYAMPGMDGLETFYELKKINKEVKVIIASGYDEKDEVKKLEKAEVLGFIQKPFRVSELLEKIEDLKL